MTRTIAVLLCLFFLPPALAEQTNENLLEADQAFQLTTRVINDTTLEASWNIAPGYYLYRDKFKFEAISGVTLGAPEMPHGKIKQDPTFGATETYTQSVRVRLPITRPENAAAARLRITAQGCNEPVGVCYPPVVKEVEFKFASTPSPLAKPGAGALSLNNFFRSANSTNTEAQPVDPEKAFIVNITAQGADTLRARIDIEDCCYLYRDKTKFELTAADGSALTDTQLGNYILPAGKIKIDEFIGKTEIYEKGFDVTLPVTGPATPDRQLWLHVYYQGCSEKGVAICYPPASKKFGIAFRDGALHVVDGADTAPTAPDAPVKSRDLNQFLLAILAAFGTGLLLSLTPCVLPMIPILSSIIIGQGGKKLTKLRGGLLSAAYVLGTAVTYAVAGTVAGASGDQLQAYFQNVWAISLFSALFVLLALSMFGFYELQMPHFIQSRLHGHAHGIKGGSFVGAFIVGLVSALIVGACVSPLLISALGVAIASRDPMLGGAIMFSMALGMGVILIAIGVGASFLLPRAGVWMDRVKHVFGVLLLALAINFLGLLPQVPVLLLWATLLIISGVYLGATQSLPANASGLRYLWKGLGTVLLIWGVIALLGGFAGQRSLLNPLPLASLATSSAPDNAVLSSPEEHLFERVNALAVLDARLAAATAAGKPVMLDFYADWCTDCLRMEKSTFANARVRAELRRRFVLLQVDLTDPNNPEGKAIKRRFGVYGPPAMLFFAAHGEEHKELRTYGFRNTEDFLALLSKI
jgi:thiol:disulfide interchange protein DsbD